MNNGWRCPGCGACYGPQVSECRRCQPDDSLAGRIERGQRQAKRRVDTAFERARKTVAPLVERELQTENVGDVLRGCYCGAVFCHHMRAALGEA